MIASMLGRVRRPRTMHAARTGRSYHKKLTPRQLPSQRRRKPYSLVRIDPTSVVGVLGSRSVWLADSWEVLD